MNETPLAPYASFARRHRWSYLAALLVSVLGTAIYLLNAPTLYRASATTIVPYREVEADLRFGNGRPFPVQYVFVVNNHLAVLRSGSTHRAILEALKTQAPNLLEELRGDKKERAGTDDEEGLLRALQRRLRASSRDKTGLLQLEATASTAELAARLANLSLHTYATVQDSLNRAAIVEWLGKLKTEETQWGDSLAAKEDALRDFRSREAGIDLEEEGRAVIREILRLRGLSVQDGAELEGQRARLAEREAQLARIYARFQERLSGDPAAVAQDLRAQLAKDEARVEYLTAAGMAGSGSQVKDLRDRIERGRAILRQQGDSLRTDPSLEGDPVELAEKLLIAIHDFQPDILGRNAQVEELDAKIDSLQRRMVVLPALAAAEARLQREAKLARQIFELVQQRRVEAEMISHQHATRLATIHPAEPPQRPASPRPLLAMASALLVALLLGTAASVVVEAFDPTVRDADEAARITGWKVLSRPRFEGGTIAPDIAAVAVVGRLAGSESGLWLLDPEGGSLDDLRSQVAARLSTAAAGVSVGAGSLESLLQRDGSVAWRVLVVVRSRRTRRGSLADTARLLNETGRAGGGLLVR